MKHSSGMSWRKYHEATKHSIESLTRAPHLLDWANMPNPFRHYEDAPILDLPADPHPPETPALAVLNGVVGGTASKDGATFLSQLFFYSASISASKRTPSTGHRYALRVNPSSGNLHPTEFHFLTRGLADWPDGLLHYRPSSHMAEQRAMGALDWPLPDNLAPMVVILTSIVSREAWKYGDRAYRYCLHDIGHAWQAIVTAAQAMGCETFARGYFLDDEVSRVCRLNEDEWPMLVIELRGSSIPVGELHRSENVWYAGHANQISGKKTFFPKIEKIHSATKLSHPMPTCMAVGECLGDILRPIKLPPPISSPRTFGEVARMRRSALNFVGGPRTISLPQLATLLAVTARPFSGDFATARFTRLYVYAHRVDGLEPGVYRFCLEDEMLEQIRGGDQRVVAAGLNLGQELAGNACVTFSMIGALERATNFYDNRGYRYVHFEAGAIGQRLYVAAEALGLGATGIGAFYDDEVHRYLHLAPGEGQVIYHFAIGYPVYDSRLNA